MLFPDPNEGSNHFASKAIVFALRFIARRPNDHIEIVGTLRAGLDVDMLDGYSQRYGTIATKLARARWIDNDE